MGEAEAGWYYVEGDPPGTVRRWNGTQWIGFAIPDPSRPASIHGANHSKLHLGQNNVHLGHATIAAMTSLAALLVLTAVSILQDVDDLRVAAATATDTSSSRSGVVRAGEIRELIGSSGVLIAFIIVAATASAATFIPWLRAAGAAVQIKHVTGRVRSGVHRIERSTLQSVLQLLVFAMFAPIWWVLRAAAGGVSTGTGKNRSMMGVVSDIAMASSTDPRTGLAAIGPIRILVWWALWWAPMAAGVVVWVWAWISGPLNINTLTTVVRVNAALLTLEAVSLLCIGVTVAQINSRLTPPT